MLETVAAVNGTSLPEGELVLHSDAGAPQLNERPAGPRSSRWADLLAPRLRRTTVLLWLVWFLISIGYYGAFTWLPSWFHSKGFSLPAVYPNAFIMALAQVPGYFSAAWLIERWGRRQTLGALPHRERGLRLAISRGHALRRRRRRPSSSRSSRSGAWGALYAYTPEAYPTSIRTTGIGAASGMTRIAGAIAPSIGALVAGASLALPLAVFAVSYAVAGFGAFSLPTESKGAPLEDEVGR